LIFADTNVLLDVVTDDPVWKSWSLFELERAAAGDRLAINEVVYSELSVRYATIEGLEALVGQMSLSVEPMPRSALFLAGKIYQQYRSAGGTRLGVLPDFFIGAHAAATAAPLITRDPRRFRTHFPGLKLIAPA
jgi:hypothetical protein